jgi:hypothetical protein
MMTELQAEGGRRK